MRILGRLAAEDPAQLAISCAGETITRAELAARSNRLARAFETLGVRYGDFVTIGLPNSIDFFVTVLACWKLGAVPQPLSPRLPAAERAAIVELADSALVVGADPADHPGRTCVAADFQPDPVLADGPLPEVVSPAWKASTSGGSTGRPKLIVAGAAAKGTPALAAAIARMRSADSQLVAGPLYHNSPLTASITGLLVGQHLVLLPRFDAHRALTAIAEHRIGWVQLVPTMMLRMLRLIEESPGAYDLSSLRALWHGASACPPWLKEAWITLLGAEKVFEMYGGTESQAATLITGPEWLTHRGSVGRAALGEIVVLDADGKKAPAGEIGEIYLRGPAGAPPSYHYLGAEARKRDDWESLGDLGWLDAEGYLYLSDRRTDLIIAGGANIYPAEVEAALDAHPLVLSSVVVGLPDTDLGQRVHALVQARPGLTVDDLLQHLGEHLVRYKVPRSVEFIDEPLRDDAGKVRRGEMRDAAIARMTNVLGEQMLGIQEISDRLEIQELIVAYATAIDSRDYDALDEVFEDGAPIDYRAFGGIATTFPEVKEWLRQSMAQYPAFQHLMVNPQIRVDGDRATGRVMCLNSMALPVGAGSGEPPVALLGMWYTDEYVRTPRGWRISRRGQQRSWVQGLDLPTAPTLI
ncbi:AMP-binding protein [Crossiella cryophila]|uniref:Bile acid-coenzyme A ligase n=1 Tax=Crossiella cryophila TaxID=43355 RepID=A0A7W7CDX5_9PSEU|nr:AMP-binding protein [Crossiella cryophila]MBB4679405.1 bile acid-coenzyme A ligase [Crossiella cryophila]